MKISKTIKVKVDRLRRYLSERRYTRAMFESCGERVFIHDAVSIHNPERVSLGDEVYVGPHSKVFGFGGIRIGRGVVVGEEAMIMSAGHEYDAPDQAMLPFSEKNVVRRVEIEDYVWIGNRAIILPGVTLAAYSVVGAGAVVSKSTEAFGVYVGNPARLVKYRQNRDLANVRATWVAAKPPGIFFLD